MHAQQVAHLWAALLVLFSVSLVLTFVRVKTQSVAASAMVHATYNGFVFLATLCGDGRIPASGAHDTMSRPVGAAILAVRLPCLRRR